MTTWDYIIVGAGSAGCVLANRLSEQGAQVLLLEAGGQNWSPFVRIPAGTIKIPASYDWRYESDPDPTREGNVNLTSAGRIIGGSSSVNGMVWARGNARDFDSWAAAGCTGWDYETVLGYFRRGETFDGGADSFRGGDGPQRVSFMRAQHPVCEQFVRSSIAAGFDFNPDYNGEQQFGVSYGQQSQRRGWRASAATAYLNPLRRRKNLTVRTHTVVSRVLIESGRAVGVEYLDGRNPVQVRCAGEVILSAGAIGSPKILMLSGIGSASQLHTHGIDVVSDVAGVGANLQEHLGAFFVSLMNVPTFNAELTPVSMLKHGLDFMVRGRGPASAGLAFALLFGTTTGSDVPSFEVMFAPFGIAGKRIKRIADVDYNKSGHDVHAMALLPTNSVTSRVSLLHPRSRGQVTLRSSDPHDAPRISHKFFEHEDDVAELIAACRRLREVYATAPLAAHVVEERMPGPAVQTDDEWRSYLSARSSGGSHPVGTCKMGLDADAVVDPELRVNGVESLRVIDASIMPTITSANTNAPAMLIAERGSDLVLGRKLDG